MNFRETRPNFVEYGLLRARLDSNGLRVIEFTGDRWICMMMASLPDIGLPKEPKGPLIPLSFLDVCDIFGPACIHHIDTNDKNPRDRES